ncbi:MAG: heavy metal-associated domain-containing protein [bacterium]|nr:heavy metal-associated domain-containing protein [bacterium]MDE0289272.1 heavy metal-associated domain-containing protein [bacterium]MDE0439660.1 heavy metal-associated domain-containing protein [bacterium]
MRNLGSRLRRRAGSHTVEFEVGGMTCGSCVARIEGILSRQPHVRKAAVDLGASRARVTLSRDASPDGVVAAVEEAGYTMAVLPARS